MLKVFKDNNKFFMQDGEATVEVGTIMSHGKAYVKLPQNSANRGFVSVDKIGENGLILEVKTNAPRQLGANSNSNAKTSYSKLLEYASDEDKATVEAILAKCEKAMKIAQLKAEVEAQMALIAELSK